MVIKRYTPLDRLRLKTKGWKILTQYPSLPALARGGGKLNDGACHQAAITMTILVPSRLIKFLQLI